MTIANRLNSRSIAANAPGPTSHSHGLAGLGQWFGPTSQPLLQVGRRRWMLQAGLAGIAGLSLPSLLQSQALGANENAPKRKATSVIQIWLSGGPSQLDM